MIMKMYINNNSKKINPEPNDDPGTFLLNPGEDSSTVRRRFVECINSLIPSFNNFKKTNAYFALHEKVKEFQDISEKVYE